MSQNCLRLQTLEGYCFARGLAGLTLSEILALCILSRLDPPFALDLTITLCGRGRQKTANSRRLAIESFLGTLYQSRSAGRINLPAQQ